MKKLLIIASVLVISLGLAGCGVKEEVKTELANCLESKNTLETTLKDVNAELNQQVKVNGELRKQLIEREELTEAIEEVAEATERKAEAEEANRKEALRSNGGVFPDQPAYIKGNDYSANTTQLVAYAKANMILRSVAKDATKVVVTLAKPLKRDSENVIIYVDTGKWKCGGRVVKDHLSDEYIYYLETMDMVPSECDGDWTKYINGTTIDAGGYVATYDGNKILDIQFK